ncbi:MAG: ferredoxin family protein [Desulfatibacillaceae bacterium]
MADTEAKTKKQKKHVAIKKEWCKGCGICIAFCPKKVLEFDKSGVATVARPEDCIQCGMCELRCPDLAMELVPDEDQDGE